MNDIKKVNFETKDQLYKYMNIKLTGLIGDEPDSIANLSNASALLWLLIEDINWVGFYLMKNGALKLGPFQGKPACVDISVGKGVCGKAVETMEVQLVENVHDFPGHIACDSNSNSEIVLPIISEGKVVAVLDIDSPTINRFNADDKNGLIKIVNNLVKNIEWHDIMK
ncbi:MAG: GAF domain-containing protein [Acidaminobacteraceae bacterium]